MTTSTHKVIRKTERYIHTFQLKKEDGLLPGLSGKSLYCRQLNRITDRLNDYFGWKNAQKVTPHVFRATLSTLLDDMQVNGDVIDFILNHHPQNVREKHYSRSAARKIREHQYELDTFEYKIEGLYEKKKSSYQEAYIYLQELKRLYLQMNRSLPWENYIEKLAIKTKKQRAFQKLLEKGDLLNV